MTKDQVITAYKAKYAAFPDLVERIVSQFDWEFWSNGNKQIDLPRFAIWVTTSEKKAFWYLLSTIEDTVGLTRESIDAAYAEFGIVKSMQEGETNTLND
jgi:hypothetical protein